MPERPTLETARLVLRPFVPGDAEDVARLAGAREIAATTLFIPHPYSVADAEKWLATHQETFDAGRGVNFALTLRGSGKLVGSVGLTVDREHEKAELGYWVGVPFWGKGYATEAAGAVVRHGFEGLGLNRVWAYHYARNRSSGRVLEKIGMRYEGVARQHIRKWGEFQDCPMYGVVRADYDRR
jgi:[ribosomal protein S5]-alanine N-acetyltransferase